MILCYREVQQPKLSEQCLVVTPLHLIDLLEGLLQVLENLNVIRSLCHGNSFLVLSCVSLCG